MPRGRGLAGILPFAQRSRPRAAHAVHGRYLVLYRDLSAENTVRVERVLHGARDLPDCYNRRSI